MAAYAKGLELLIQRFVFSRDTNNRNFIYANLLGFGFARPRVQFVDFEVPLVELVGEILQIGLFVFHDSLWLG
jgi:hypothetical protein